MRKTLFSQGLILLALSLAFTACVRKKFDVPPLEGATDPKDIVANKTILELKQGYSGGNDSIKNDWIISGVVISSDKDGSFYKEIIIQDSTAGISIKLDKQGTHYEYPIGRRVFVKLKGLMMSSYGKFIQIGYKMDNTNSLAEIPGIEIPKYIVKGSTGNIVKPKKMSIVDLKGSVNDLSVLGTLVEIESVQFPSSLNGQTFAQPSTIASGTDRAIQDCDLNEINLRLSGYSNFQSKLLPTGRGTARVIMSKYNDKPQLLISSPSDLKFDGDRCPFGSATDTLISISDLRAMWTPGGTTPIPLANRKIRGVVISNGENSSNRNLIIQERGGKGIMCRFKSGTDIYALGYGIGDSVEVLLNNVHLGENSGHLQVGVTSGSELAANQINKVASVAPIVPREMTIAAVLADFENLESTLVTFKNLKKTNGVEEAFYSGAASSGGNGGNITLTDDNNVSNIICYVASYCPWKAVTCKVDIAQMTGIIVHYKTSSSDKKEITPRTITDIIQ